MFVFVSVLLSCLVAICWEMSGLLALSCFYFTFPCVSWSTSELRVRWVPLSMLSPPVKKILFAPRRCFFRVSFLLFVLRVCLCFPVVSVPCSLVITWRKRADLLALCAWCFTCVFCQFLIWCPWLGLELDCFDSRSCLSVTCSQRSSHLYLKPVFSS